MFCVVVFGVCFVVLVCVLCCWVWGVCFFCVFVVRLFVVFVLLGGGVWVGGGLGLGFGGCVSCVEVDGLGSWVCECGFLSEFVAWVWEAR